MELNMMEIRYDDERAGKIEIVGGKKVMYITESKFKALFPLAYRRGLEVIIVGEDEDSVIVSTYLPEQRKPRLKRVPKWRLFGDVKYLLRFIPPAGMVHGKRKGK